MSEPRRIGIIAGGGQFPLIFARTARSRGFAVYAAAYRNEAVPEIEDVAEATEWLHLGQLARLMKFFKRHDVAEAVMMGTIQKTRLFTDVRPDIKAISLMARLRSTHDDGVLRAFAGALEAEGVLIRASTFLLPELLAEKGCWTRRAPKTAERSDMELGWRIAGEIGRLDIGQCVVVSGGSVLAVEAVEGTDAAIARAGTLCNGGAVVIKRCKPNQDVRFDIPAVGLRTIETMQAAGATVLAVEAGKTVVFDRERMIAAADAYNISIVGCEMQPPEL